MGALEGCEAGCRIDGGAGLDAWRNDKQLLILRKYFINAFIKRVAPGRRGAASSLGRAVFSSMQGL
jgi:hypothetical protein